MWSNENESREWPNAALFAIYDGHGGSKCADFLRDNLHNYLVIQPSYPLFPIQALHETILYSEQQY